MTETVLDRLAARVGIVPRYHQVDGTERVAGPETLRALLAAMGVAAGTETDAARSLAALGEADAGRTLPREIVVIAGAPSDHLLPDWRLTLESGETLDPGPGPHRLPPLPDGVHVLESVGGRSLVIAAPAVAPSVAALAGRPRIWGATGALYALRSDRNAGVGDYADLGAAAEGLAAHGAAFLGINPAHARGVADHGTSPYSPSSRTAFDTGHIALDRIPEMADCAEAQALMAGAARRLAEARAADLVDYTARRTIAEPVLRALFRSFEGAGETPRRAGFETWRAGRHATVARQSVFEALSLHHGPDWRVWPVALRDPGSDAVRDFAARHPEEIRYHDWRQWIAETQIAEAQRRAVAAGMALGLYLDVAVGVRPGGAETWASGHAFATGCSLGAPPDLLNSEGQRWDLAPYSPLGLAEADYRPVRAMLRTAMAHSGMVRIDHVIGFRRSFWVPDDGAPGGYVTFPQEVMLALTRLEASRADCVVVGEDLGTVPDGLREALDASGLLGCAIVPFEREGDGYMAPEHYRARTLASFGTHDLPTIAGWWRGRDIEIRRDLGHLAGEPLQWAWDERAWLRRCFCRMLADRGLLPEGVDPEDPPWEADRRIIDAMHALVARAGSDAVAVLLDDMTGEAEPQNVPGTVHEQPNWRRRHRIGVGEMAVAEALARVARIMAEERGGGHAERHAAGGAAE